MSALIVLRVVRRTEQGRTPPAAAPTAVGVASLNVEFGTDPRQAALRSQAWSTRSTAAQGNTEGTPARARASTRSYSYSADSFFLRGFRARGFLA